MSLPEWEPLNRCTYFWLPFSPLSSITPSSNHHISLHPFLFPARPCTVLMHFVVAIVLIYPPITQRCCQSKDFKSECYFFNASICVLFVSTTNEQYGQNVNGRGQSIDHHQCHKDNLSLINSLVRRTEHFLKSNSWRWNQKYCLTCCDDMLKVSNKGWCKWDLCRKIRDKELLSINQVFREI